MPKLSKQEYSSRTLGATWGIISAVMVPIVIILICIGWRILQRRKAEEKEENEYLNVKTRALDPDESMKTDDESIPYKKDVTEDSPEPTDGVKVVDNPEPNDPAYGLPYPPYDQNQDYQTQPYPSSGEPYPSPSQPYPSSSQAYPSSSQPFNPNVAYPPPPPPQPGQPRQWSGETEIN